MDAFDVTIRALECQQCAAPISAPASGGSVACAFCGATNLVLTRRSDAPRATSSLADEVARLSRLKAQLTSPLSGHAYDMAREPAGLHARTSTARLQEYWRQARTEGVPVTVEGQRRLCWLALALAARHAAEGRDAEARATLETGLDRLPDAGHRHLLRCQLALSALQHQEPASAEGWLSECDPAPEVLELDTAWRHARARLLLACRDDGEPLLDLLGRTPGDIPLHPRYADLPRLRIHALERAGDLQAAQRLLRAEPHHLDALEAEGLAPRAAALLRGQQHKDLDRKKQRSDEDHRRREAREEEERQRREEREEQERQRREHDHREQDEQQLRKLLAERAALPGAPEALASALYRAPLLALGLLLLLLFPRMLDLDPLLGVQGYALCPAACPRCEGPLRMVTVWHPDGPGEWSSNGPQFFCPAPENGIARMSNRTLEEAAPQLGRWELHYAPAATSWLLLLLGALQFAFLGAIGRWWRHRAPRRKLRARIDALADRLGGEIAAAARRPVVSGLRRALGVALALAWLGGWIAAAVGITALELWGRQGG